jgi:hypothetical protein
MRTLTELVAVLTVATSAWCVGGCCNVPSIDDLRGGGKPGAATTTTTTTSLPMPVAVPEVSVVPGTERTPVPTSAEWASVPRLTTNGDDSCEAKKVREWIQIYCRHCANDQRKPGAICSDKYDYAEPQMARGSKTGEVSFYTKKNADKSSISAAVFPVRLGADIAVRVPGIGGPPSTFGGVWRRGTPGPVIGFQ